MLCQAILSKNWKTFWLNWVRLSQIHCFFFVNNSCIKFEYKVEFDLRKTKFIKRGELMEGNFNRHLGSKLRLRRLALGLTQTKVAQAINVTFQQIQKYEKGTNGISSLRIMQLSNFLRVPVVYFFEDYPGYNSSSSDNIGTEDINYSFMAKLFSGLSSEQKEKIFQVLRNTKNLEKTG